MITRLGKLIRKIECIPRYRMFDMIKKFNLDDTYNDSYRYSGKKSDYDLQEIILQAAFQRKICGYDIDAFIDTNEV